MQELWRGHLRLPSKRYCNPVMGPEYVISTRGKFTEPKPWKNEPTRTLLIFVYFFYHENRVCYNFLFVWMMEGVMMCRGGGGVHLKREFELHLTSFWDNNLILHAFSWFSYQYSWSCFCICLFLLILVICVWEFQCFITLL